MSLPEWAGRIRRLIVQLGQNQESIAKRLGVSPATLSRWVNGKNEPTPEMYVALGNLAGNPQGTYFWERAGIELYGSPVDTMRRELTSTTVSATDFELIANKRLSSHLTAEEKLVAVPLLSVPVYADEHAPGQNASLTDAQVEDVLTAPADWCPHPTSVIAMRVVGESMFPTIPGGAIVLVDTASNQREKLDRRIVVVAHRDLGFKVARLQQLNDAYLMVSSNHKCMPVDITNATVWKILGEVLWWISHDDGNDPQPPQSTHPAPFA